MARPRPEPPNFRAWLESAWTNSRKISSRFSFGTPTPVSRTSKYRKRRSGPSTTRTESSTPPRSVNLTALPTRLVRTWRSRTLSLRTTAGTAGSTMATSSMSLSCARGQESSTTASIRGRKSTSSSSGREGARFDLGEIQDVADQREQGLARLADRLHIGALFGPQFGLQQQARHAQDAVHRRADLMAHRGEKAGLGAAAGFGLVARLDDPVPPAPCAR